MESDQQREIIRLQPGTGGCNAFSLPASKSISNRLLILQALSSIHFIIENLSEAEDTTILKNLLVKIRENTGKSDVPTILNVVHAGTTFRFLTALLAITPGNWVLTGSERMQQRPIKELVDALKSINADIRYLKTPGFPPLQINGKPLRGGEVELESHISSQFVSALLMIAPVLPDGLKIRLKKTIVSQPYIIMTLQFLERFGVRHTWENTLISIANQPIIGIDTFVEPDWSAAACWYQLIAFSKEMFVVLYGLQQKSLQGDAMLSNLFTNFGVSSRFLKEGVMLTNTGKCTDYFEQDCIQNPDLAIALTITCAGLGIPCCLTGLNTLVNKESNRLLALQQGLTGMGANVTLKNNNTIMVHGKASFSKGVVQTRNDHRLALGFAPLAAVLGEIVLNHPDVINKSYPDWWNHLKLLGWKVSQSRIHDNGQDFQFYQQK